MNPLQEYYNAIKHCKVLTDEECRELQRRVKGGDTTAREPLVSSCLRLAYKIAHKYQRYAPLEDLVSEANIAIIKCVETWNPDKGPFGQHVAFKVRFHLADSIPEVGYRAVKVPRHADAKSPDGFIRVVSLDSPSEDGDGWDPPQPKAQLRGHTPCIADLETRLSKLKLRDRRVHDLFVRRHGLLGQEPTPLDLLAAQFELTEEEAAHHIRRAKKVLELRTKCAYCKGPMRALTSQRKFCSGRCTQIHARRAKRPYPECRMCKHCKGDFWVVAAQTRKWYCSDDCARAATSIPGVCRQCGRDFTHQRSQDTKCCSRRCADQWKKEHTESMVWKECDQCHKSFRYSLKDNVGKVRRFCSVDCYRTNRWGGCRKVQRECKRCHAMFTSSLGRPAVYCSRACKTGAQRMVGRIKVCPGCGGEFTLRHSRDQKYCNNPCRNRHKSELAAARRLNDATTLSPADDGEVQVRKLSFKLKGPGGPLGVGLLLPILVGCGLWTILGLGCC